MQVSSLNRILVGCALSLVGIVNAQATKANYGPAPSGAQPNRKPFVFPPKVGATLKALKELSLGISARDVSTNVDESVAKALEGALAYIAPVGLDFLNFTNEGVDSHFRVHSVRHHVTQAQLRQQIARRKGREILWLKEFLRGLRVRALGSPSRASLVGQDAGTIRINLSDEYVVTFSTPNADAKILRLESLLDPEGGD